MLAFTLTFTVAILFLSLVIYQCASIVGNSKHTGIGLLGFDRVNQEVLNRIGSIGSKAKAKREAYTIELNALLKKNQLLYAFDSNPNNNGKAVVDYSSNNSMVDDIPA
eukprot:gene25060-33571_t